MATTLEALIAKLSQTTPYKALTQAQMKEQAARRYQSVYDQKRLSAQQEYETSDAALLRQLDTLQASYDRRRDESRAQNRYTYSEADRHALSRGMQRSSYNEGTLANIRLAGEAALQEIGRQQTEAEDSLAAERTQLSQQLSQLLKQYDTDQLNDELAYMDELAAREYDRVTASANTQNELAMKIYEYQHELEQEALEQARWEAEFRAKYKSSKSKAKSGGGSRKKKTGTESKTNESLTGSKRN